MTLIEWTKTSDDPNQSKFAREVVGLVGFLEDKAKRHKQLQLASLIATSKVSSSSHQ